MKRIILPIVVAVSSTILHVHAQVGVNTEQPASTLDITAKNATGTTKNVDGLLIPRVDRERAQNMSSVPTSTLIYINSASTGTQTGTAINIDAVGYYYYNGTAWTKLASTASTNIYNADGSLSANRTVTQGANTLALTGTAVNAFSVDGNTLSVDAANNRVGVGNAAPNSKFFVRGSNSQPVSGTLNTDATVRIDGGTSHQMEMGTLSNSPWGGYINSINGSGTGMALALNSVGGNVGVGTVTPQKTMHVNGSLQVTNELNVGGTSTAQGSAGTTGQVLTSAGTGAAPTWTTPAASTNIYNADGSLSANRTVAQGANTLAFSGTAANAFSVDGTTLSVDAANDRIGVGTATPQKKLHVNGALQVTNELNVGGTSTAQGSAGTTGQVLTSAGTGAAPTWTTPAASTNIYNADGSLSANRTVAQGANTLALTGTAVNAFSVDGNTLSVDAANNRVGVGNAAPNSKFFVRGSNSQPVSGTLNTDAIVRIDGGTSHQMEMGTLSNSPWGGYINSINGSGTGIALALNSVGGNVGVGTVTPQKTMHVNGSLQVTNELNVGGTSTAQGSAGTTGQVLTSAGTGAAPTWTTPAASTNIYNADGSLSANRTVTQGANTLALTGTAVNAFSVDGTTLSVDAANDRIGVGTATPQKNLHVNGALQVTNELNVGGTSTAQGSAGTAGQVLTSAGTGAAPTWTTPAASTNIYNADGSLSANRTVTQGANTLAFTGTGNVGLGASTPAQKLTVVDATNNSQYSGIASFSAQNLTQGVGIGYAGIQSIGNNTNVDLNLNAKGTGNIVLQNNGTTGRVGIGTATPQKNLHVNGALQVTSELNVGGSASAAGSAGTTGQVLTSAGTGAAPTWTTPAASTNIYNADGSLSANRTVAQGANTLALTGTAVNAFSVDGNTLSVDAANNRVGVGNAAPNSKFFVRGSNSQPVSGTLNTDAIVRIDGGTSHQMEMGTLSNSPWGGYINSINGSGTGIALALNSVGGNVGVGTVTPQKTMHVNGSLQVTNELNVGGTSTAQGSAGTTGQVLTSAGTGAAPTWTTPAASTNIYNTNGALTGNRTVTQGANTLAFSGTASNAFSVDGTTLSVDAANDRIGVGTTSPNARLNVSGSTYTSALTSGTANNNAVTRVQIGNSTLETGFMNTSPYATYLSSIDSNYSTGLPLTLNPVGGNVGIGTLTPQKSLHVNGALQVTSELNVGGSTSTAGSAGSAGQVLTSAGAGAAPTWTTPTALTNIYNADGSLTGNRTVTQGANTLALTGTAVNAFSVDGNTLSVDAANNRVGIGTSSPTSVLDLGTSAGKKLAVYNNTAGTDFYGLGIGGGTIELYAGNLSHMTLNNSGNIGVGTTTPQKKMHVNGSLQVTNELNVGGTSTAQGSAGTAGQVLTSAGAGAAPTWKSLADVTPTSTGTVLVVDGKFIIAQEIVVQMSNSFTTSTSGVATPIGHLNNEIIDNENKFSGTATGNTFQVSNDGTYQLTMSALLSNADLNSYPVIGIYDDTDNKWIARVNDQFVSPGNTSPAYPPLQTYSLVTSFPMQASHTYSFRIAASQSTVTIRSLSSAGGNATIAAPVTQMGLKRLK